MDLKLFALSAALFSASIGSIAADTAKKPLPTEDDRYAISKLENGYLRLDKQTGDLTHCVIDGHEAWKCVIVPDTRAKHQEKLDALKSENAFLKARQKAMETRLVELEETLFDLRDRLSAAEKQEPGKPKSLISKQQRKKLDEALDVADAMVSRFGDVMRGLKDEAKELGSKVPKILD